MHALAVALDVLYHSDSPPAHNFKLDLMSALDLRRTHPSSFRKDIKSSDWYFSNIHIVDKYLHDDLSCGISCLGLSRMGMVAAGLKNGHITIRRFDAGNQVETVRVGRELDVVKVIKMIDESSLLCSCQSGGVYHWDYHGNQRPKIIYADDRNSSEDVLTSCGKSSTQFFSASLNGKIRKIDLRVSNFVVDTIDVGDDLSDLTTISCGKGCLNVAVGSKSNNLVYIYDIRKFQPHMFVRKFRSVSMSGVYGINECALSHIGELLVSHGRSLLYRQDIDDKGCFEFADSHRVDFSGVRGLKFIGRNHILTPWRKTLGGLRSFSVFINKVSKEAVGEFSEVCRNQNVNPELVDFSEKIGLLVMATQGGKEISVMGGPDLQGISLTFQTPAMNEVIYVSNSNAELKLDF